MGSWARRLAAIDLRSLAALRIGLGALLLVDLGYRSLDLRAHYTDAGVLPRSALQLLKLSPENAWSLHTLGGSALWEWPLFGVAWAAAFAFLLGYRTRLAGLLSWVLLLSIQHRNPLILIGADLLLRILLFWALLLPVGARWSLDRRAGRVAQDGRECTASLASAGLLLQVAVVYLFSVYFKLLQPEWRDLSALERTLQVEGVATGLGRSLLAAPELLVGLTALTLALEGLAVLLLFCPWRTSQVRTLLALAMAAFHLLGIGATLRLGLISWTMALAWVPFLGGSFWDRLGRRFPAVGDDRAPERAPRRALLLDAMAALGLVLVVADNVISIDRERLQPVTPRPLEFGIGALGLGQGWHLWDRPLLNRYYVFPATLRDGSRVDLHRGAPLDWDRPRRRSRNNHWWKYQLHVSRVYGAPLRPHYARYLVRSWNRGRDPDRRVDSLELVYVDGRPEAPPGRLPRWVLWSGAAADLR